MKLPALFSLLFLPLLALAASPRHQVLGPIKFGMTRDALDRARSQFLDPIRKVKHREMDASDIRNHFVTTGVKYPSKLAGNDAACSLDIFSVTDPFLSELKVRTIDTDYGKEIQQWWSTLQDIGNSKFTRVGTAGQFPTKESFEGKSQDVITDTWEVEGVRIQLIVNGGFSADGVSSSFIVMLKASEIAPPATK